MHDKAQKLITAAAVLAAAGGVTAGIATAARDGSGDGREERRGFHEPALTGETKEKAEAAALEAVPGGTVVRSEEDAHGGAKYEVHMTDAEGDPVTVLLDEAFAVVEQREDGPRGHHRPPGEALTGEAKERAEEAAEQAVDGGTARESFAVPEGGPSADAAYAVLVERANGRPVVVLLDADYAVVRKLTRPPHRGPHHGPGFRGGPPPYHRG